MFSITTRLLGFLSGGLGLALAAASLFGYVQTTRLSAAHEVSATLRHDAQLLNRAIVDRDTMIATRDTLITTQNASVQAMADQAQQDRTAYLARIATADKVAHTYQTQAANIMARQASTQDELERSREALKLIQDVVGQGEGSPD